MDFFVDFFHNKVYYILSNTKYIVIRGVLMNEVSKQLKKGVIEILVLKILSLENLYGYQIIQLLDEKSEGTFKMKEGTLYPILYRLEDSKLIESYWEAGTEKRGVPRKYYRITEAGRQQLLDMQQEWYVMADSINLILRMEGV
ncbi:MAG: DNA-binding protein [Clostridia bacterium]|nr:DNA-binding protein [Clostridia bacterium]